MKNCKYCHAELVEPSTICPKCGKDNAEETPNEAPKESLSTGKTVLTVLAAVAVLVLLVAAVMNLAKQPVEEATLEAPIVEAETAPMETTAPTIPADGDPNTVAAKGTYYAADDVVIAARDTVVATAGDRELTVGQLQVYYWMEVRNFLTQYGAYAAYFGLDPQLSFDTQLCGVSEVPMTWQQFFLDSALQKWASYSTVAAAAQIDGFVLPEEQEQTLANAAEELEAAAVANGYESAVAMLHSSLGPGAEMADYTSFMEAYYRANGYYNQLAEAVTYTDEELEAFFDAHSDDYAQSGISKDDVLVDVRHILLYPEGADSATVRTEEFSEEAWAAGEAAAQALLDEWKAGDMTEESFAALANANSQDPGSNTNGGLYTDVTEGEMVQTFNDWCFDAARQVGDTGIVRTEYGFHVMYFSGSHAKWPEYARNDLVSEQTNAKIMEIESASPMTVRYSDILICNIDLT